LWPKAFGPPASRPAAQSLLAAGHGVPLPRIRIRPYLGDCAWHARSEWSGRGLPISWPPRHASSGAVAVRNSRGPEPRLGGPAPTPSPRSPALVGGTARPARTCLVCGTAPASCWGSGEKGGEKAVMGKRFLTPFSFTFLLPPFSFFFLSLSAHSTAPSLRGLARISKTTSHCKNVCTRHCLRRRVTCRSFLET